VLQMKVTKPMYGGESVSTKNVSTLALKLSVYEIGEMRALIMSAVTRI
jgi:hypothetical protein